MSTFLLLQALMFFFFNDTATTEIYTLSLHDALPIYRLLPGARGAAAAGRPLRRVRRLDGPGSRRRPGRDVVDPRRGGDGDRKSTRLNSSHANISYAVFCLKKKKQHKEHRINDPAIVD